MTKTDLFSWWVILFIMHRTVIMFAEARIRTPAQCHDGTPVRWETASRAHARTWATVNFRKREKGTVLHRTLSLFVSVNNCFTFGLLSQKRKIDSLTSRILFVFVCCGCCCCLYYYYCCSCYYISLFFASEQCHSAVVAWDSESLTVALHSVF